MDFLRAIAKYKRNKIVRVLIAPFAEGIRRHQLHEYWKTEDSEQLKKLKDIHHGQRCFIIGNGSSLKPSDLDRIRGEFSFAVNRIYYIYEYTAWRPTYYVSIDMESLPLELENIKKGGNYIKFLNYECSSYGREVMDKIIYIMPYGRYNVNVYDKVADSLSEDISDHVTKVHTVTVTSVEIAIYMGFKEIYLLGVDHNYANKVDHSGKVYKDSTVSATYFKGMKDSKGKPGDENSSQNVEAMENSYLLAKDMAEKKGVKIYNATRGGKLEIFERISFDEISGMNDSRRVKEKIVKNRIEPMISGGGVFS